MLLDSLDEYNSMRLTLLLAKKESFKQKGIKHFLLLKATNAGISNLFIE
jgi:hypothetical protein